MVPDTLHDWMRMRAVRALKVAILYQGALRICAAQRMIVLREVDLQCAQISLLFLQTFEGLENSVCARIHADRRAVAPANDAIFVNHEEGPFCYPIPLAIGAITTRNCTLGFKVSEKGKMQPAVLGKGGMTPGSVYRDAQQLGAMLLKFGEDFVIKRHLIAAYRTPIGWVEGQDDRFAAQFAEGDLLVRCNRQLKIGRCRTGGQDCRHIILQIFQNG